MEEPQPQPQSPSHGTDCRDTRIIAKLRDSLLSQASTFSPSVIGRRVMELFNSFNTPTHPPYALMIQRAVMELNEETGSTEEAISEFIKKEFEDLPWAHTRILGLHLRKLCQAEELLCTQSGRYMLMVDGGDFGGKKETGWRGSKRRKRSKRGRNDRVGERNKRLERNEGTERDNGLQEQENEEQNQLSELHGSGTNEPNRMIEREDEGIEEQGEEHQQSIEMIEEQGKYEKGLLGMAEECHGRLAQAQGEAEKPQNESMDERIQEAIMELNDKIGLSEILNTEHHMAKEQQDIVIDKHIQYEKQPYELLATAENQTLTQQVEFTTGILKLCTDEKSKDKNLSASLGGPTIAVIPREKLQILEQEEEQQQNETPSVQQKFSDACELLVDQEDPLFHLETTCSSQPTAPDLPVDLTSNLRKHLVVPISSESPHIPSAGIEITPTQLQLQMSKCGPSETDLCAASKMSASLSSMNLHEPKHPQDWIQGTPKGRLDENKAFGDPEQHSPKPRRSGRRLIPKPVADYPVESLPPSDDGVLNDQKPKNYKIKKQQLLQPQGWGRGRGRGRPRKLGRNPRKLKEQLQLMDHALGPVSSPNLEPKETIHSLQPAPNLPVKVAPNHQQQLSDLISEGTPGCIPSTKEELSSIQLLLQMSWHRLIDGGLGTTSKMEASLSSVNVYEDKPQHHGNKGNPKRKLDLDEKTAFGDLEQQPPNCQRRGRPPNPKPVEDYSGVSMLPSDDGIHNEKNPTFYNIVKQRQLQQQGRGRSRGRDRGRSRSRGEGRGRPPKLNHNAHHCEELSPDSPQDQTQGQVDFPNLPDDGIQSWELKQLKLQSQAQSQRRRPKLESGVDGSCQKPRFIPQGSSRGHGNGRGRRQLQQLKTLEVLGSSPKPISNAHQSHQQLQPETCQGQSRRFLRSHSALRQGKQDAS